jgi:hypothetical protein
MLTDATTEAIAASHRSRQLRREAKLNRSTARFRGGSDPWLITHADLSRGVCDLLQPGNPEVHVKGVELCLLLLDGE